MAWKKTAPTGMVNKDGQKSEGMRKQFVRNPSQKPKAQGMINRDAGKKRGGK